MPWWVTLIIYAVKLVIELLMKKAALKPSSPDDKTLREQLRLRREELKKQREDRKKEPRLGVTGNEPDLVR